MSSMTAAARVLTLAAFALICGACDHGGAFIVENKTDQELIARVTGTEEQRPSSVLTFHPRQDLFVLPAGSRLAVALLHFKDPFNIDTVEILTSDCVLVASFDEWHLGSLMTVNPGPTATRRREFPESGSLATATERCREPGQ